jgi:DNA-binding IclR family transcriptional regulator
MSPHRAATGAPTALLERALQILGCFGPDANALTLTKIAERTALPLSSCHRIVGTLVTGGFLDRGADRRYRVGTTLWTIAQHAPLSDRLRESALPALARLYEETGENITLAVFDRGQALYVERLMGERSIPTVSRAGGHLPLHTTGVGKVLLAYQPRDSIDQPDRLRRDLDAVRERGYSMTRQEMTAGSGSIAVPIVHNGACVAAVGVIVHLARLDVNRLVGTLNRAATAIVAELELLE